MALVYPSALAVSLFQRYNSMVLRNLTPDEIGKQRKDVFGEEREDSIDKLLTYINKKWKGDPKVRKKTEK